jgi:hypothetical protein
MVPVLVIFDDRAGLFLPAINALTFPGIPVAEREDRPFGRVRQR